jgi:hypothetical protein
MSGFPSDLRARVYRSRAANGSTAHDPTVGLHLRSDPFERHGRIWQWVVDIDPGLPTLTEVLASCHDFLVDDDCGREVVRRGGYGPRLSRSGTAACSAGLGTASDHNIDR